MDPARALWIGGPQGSGKSSVARALADRFGLRLYHLGERAPEHEGRMAQPAPGSGATLEQFTTASRHRVRLVLEDLRALPDGPAVIVEGSELFPTSVSALIRFPDQALFLLPDAAGVPARDLPILRTIEREARELRLPVLRVDAGLDELIERAAAGFAPAVERLSDAGGTSR